ncbi:MAG: DUF819 family protein [Clostridia bacterium]|nr:DUF819 family protein [Clostridia bacterium]
MWGKIFDTANPLVGAENTWVLWAILCGCVALSIWLEQKYSWASKMSGAIIALIFALALTNLGIIPADCPTWDNVWGYVVPLAIPLLLLQCNIKKIWKESGRVLIIYLIGAIGTTLGAILAFTLLKSHIPYAAGVAAMMTGSYIGGGVNFVALSTSFNVPGEVVSATTVSDNLLMALYFFVLVAIPATAFFKKHFKHPHLDEVEAFGISEENKTLAAKYWGRKEISLKDIAFAVGTSFIIVAVSGIIADFLAAVIPTTNFFFVLLNGMLGNKYLIITTITMILATVKPETFGEIKGSQEIGTYLIYLFFFVIGVPASIPLIVEKSPLLLVFCAIMVLVNMIVIFVLGKIFKFNLEEIILASNANIGGPTTAAAMAISKGWTKLVAPILLVGTLGYVIGTYLGILVGNIIGA